MQLVVCIITYNDWPLIKQCVDSIYDQADKIIAVDGKYDDFKGNAHFSTDGTTEYLESLDKVDLYYVSGTKELYKRNYYLQFVNEGDTVFNIDADEVVVGKIYKLDVDWGIIDLLDSANKNHKHRRATRFFKYKNGIEYKCVHYTLYYNGRQINTSTTVVHPEFKYEIVKDFHIVHNAHLRSFARRQDKMKYYKKLVKMESGYPK